MEFSFAVLEEKLEFSTTRKSVLEEIQRVREDAKSLKILKISATCWLSNGNSTKRKT